MNVRQKGALLMMAQKKHSSNIITGTRDWTEDGWYTTWGAIWTKTGEYYCGCQIVEMSDRYNGVGKRLNVIAGTPYTFSIYYKADNQPYALIYVSDEYGHHLIKTVYIGNEFSRISATYIPSSDHTITFNVQLESPDVSYSAGYMVSTDGSIEYESADGEI